jgi:rRNA maturation endonuclease Nob1
MTSGAQTILLDSNAYFRLGISVDHLLQEPFGAAPRYSLRVLAELDDEYKTSTRLQHKFEWVRQKEHVEDRAAKRYTVPNELRSAVDTAFTFLADYADSQQLNASREDLKALAVGFAAQIPVVTDDRNMTTIAETHQIECWNTVKLLRVMVSAGRIDMAKVTEVFEYWEYEKDLPMPLTRLRKVFREYFGSNCPI